MNDQIHSFLDAIDVQMANFAATGEALDLYIFGRAALVAQYGFPFSTRDIDIVRSTDSWLQAKAIELFGKTSALACSAPHIPIAPATHEEWPLEYGWADARRVADETVAVLT